jgi:hypothetical protein
MFGMLVKDRTCRAISYHFKCPHSPYPHFQLALDASDVVELDTLPPASASGFPPEEEQLLGHSDSITVGEVVALDVGPQACECNTADDGLVGFAGAVTPAVVVVEATARVSKQEPAAEANDTYPAVNISIRCCSVVPGSSLFLRPEKIPSCLSKASPAARLTSIISG